jgi:hypothetical protein
MSLDQLLSGNAVRQPGHTTMFVVFATIGLMRPSVGTR